MVLTVQIGQGRTARVCFSGPAARAALEPHVDLLCRPEAHEGPEMVRVKTGASRTVWRCLLDGQGYYLKCYHSGDLGHRLGSLLRGDDARREMAVSRRLRQAGVRTIDVLAAGRCGRASWMLSREIAAAVPLNLWHDARAAYGRQDDPVVRRVAARLAEQLGRMHAAGLFHGDLHAGNILLEDPEGRAAPAIMDLHRIRRRCRCARRAGALDLAMLMHDRQHATTRTRRLAFLRRYLQAAGHGGTLRGWAVRTAELARRHRRGQWALRDRRLERPGRYFGRLRLAGGWRGRVMLACKRPSMPTTLAQSAFTPEQWATALAGPLNLLEGPDVTLVKDSPRVRIVRRALRVGSCTVPVYIKHAYGRHGLRGLADLLRPSRALRAFARGHALVTRRIPTPLPLAALERRRGRRLRDSLLITEAVPDARPLNRFLQPPPREAPTTGREADRRRSVRELPAQLGRLLRELHAEGFCHRDIKAANLLVTPGRGGRPLVVLIDLDGLSRPWILTRRQRFQGLMRLNVSLLECPGVNHAGRLRMLLGYLRRPGAGRIHFKPYWRELERWSARKLTRRIRSRRRRQRRRRDISAADAAAGTPPPPA